MRFLMVEAKAKPPSRQETPSAPKYQDGSLERFIDYFEGLLCVLGVSWRLGG